MKRVFILVTSSDVSFLFYIRAIDHFKIAWLWGFKLVEIVPKIQDSFANQTSTAKYEKKRSKKKIERRPSDSHSSLLIWATVMEICIEIKVG